MTKVVSTVPKSRFETFKVSFPESWEIAYVPYPIGDDELIAACKGADFLFVGSMHLVPRSVIVNSPSLKMIHVEGVGFDKVDTAAAKEVNLPVCNNRASNNSSVAEHTVGLMIAALRCMPQSDAKLKANISDYAKIQSGFRMAGVHDLGAQHVGFIGMGAIGQEAARMLGAFGCQLSYYDAYRPKPETEAALKLTYKTVDEIISECDIISMHVPVLPETINMISTAQFNAMKPNALLINTARGEVIDQNALAVALESGRIFGAALDTVNPEPPTADQSLYNLSPAAAERLILTPHLGGTTVEAFTRMLNWAIASMQAMTEGGKPNNIVNGVVL